MSWKRWNNWAKLSQPDEAGLKTPWLEPGFVNRVFIRPEKLMPVAFIWRYYLVTVHGHLARTCKTLENQDQGQIQQASRTVTVPGDLVLHLSRWSEFKLKEPNEHLWRDLIAADQSDTPAALSRTTTEHPFTPRCLSNHNQYVTSARRRHRCDLGPRLHELSISFWAR